MKWGVWAAVLSFAVAVALGPVIIPWLKKLKFGTVINELGPEAHKAKQGTPAMGGVLFAIPIVLVSILLCALGGLSWRYLLIALCSVVGFGAVGFADDYIKLGKKRSVGLTPMQKIIPQVVISFALALWAYLTPEIGDGLIGPFTGRVWHLGIFYIPVMMFILVGTTNSANLLDGVDGLLGGCSVIDFAAFGVICLALGAQGDANMTALVVLCGACLGGVLGFLRYNVHPAQVFMGDVGSFVIGGAVVALAMITRTSLYLPIVALAMFVSSLSDIIQVGYFKYTKKKTGAGKRVFRMAPLHHHFELGGMKETQIVCMYMSATALLCLIALALFL